jgi:hypothetical protein
MESRADYRNRYLVASTDRLDRYLEVIETMAQQSGLEPETLRRQPRGDRREAIPENREFEWLALWQTAGLRYGEIQEQYRFSTSSGYSALYDESSIRKAIRAAAQRVGIALRK